MKFDQRASAGRRHVAKTGLLFFAPLLFSSCVALGQQGGPPVLDRLPFRLSVQFEVGGKPFAIERVLACDMRRRLHPGPDSEPQELKRREIWEPNVRNVFEVLPDGSVVVVYTPLVCDTFAKQLKPLPQLYIPTIAWLSARNAFDIVEFYISRRYYERPNARIVFRGIQVAPLNSNEKIVDDHQFRSLRLGGRPFEDSNWESSRYFMGVTVATYPAPVWEGDRLLSEHMGKLKTATVVRDESALRRVFAIRAYPTLLHTNAEGLGLPLATSRLDHVSAAEPREGNWHLNESDVGVIRMHYEPNQKVQRGRLDLLFANVRSQSVVIGNGAYREALPFVVFDPSTGHLHLVSRENLIW